MKKWRVIKQLTYHKVGEIITSEGKLRPDRFKDGKLTIAENVPGDLHLSIKEHVYLTMYTKQFKETYFETVIDPLKEPLKEYKRLHAELMAEPNLSFIEYQDKNAKLKSAMIVFLKMKKVPGKTRNQLNVRMQSVGFRRTREFLYARDPTCGICGKPIETLKEVTIDHIIPKFAGGLNHWTNKQIAHKDCNSKIKNQADWEKYGRKVVHEAKG